jgi:tryptophan synthase beta subunit
VAPLEDFVPETEAAIERDSDYIVVGETAGPPPQPTGHRAYQRPMGRKVRSGRRGAMS